MYLADDGEVHLDIGTKAGDKSGVKVTDNTDPSILLRVQHLKPHHWLMLQMKQLIM